MSKRKKKPKLVPPRGPATKLRPAGAHEDKRRKALEQLGDRERELEDLRTLGRWAYDEDE